MRLLSIIILLSSFSYAQDTIVKSNGNVIPTKIISIDKSNEVVVHVISKDTIFSSFSGIQSLIQHSEINTTSVSPSLIIKSPYDYWKAPLRKRPFKYEYGKWSMSFNPLALLALGFTNSKIHLTPEFQLNDYFSITTPLKIGIFQYEQPGELSNRKIYYNRYEIDYVEGELGTPEPLEREPNENIKFEIGLNSKFYPWKKSKRPFSFYLGAGLSFGMVDFLQYDWYTSMDTTSSQWDNEHTWWIQHYDYAEVNSNQFFFGRVEGFFGLEINVSKSVTLGLETGILSPVIGKLPKKDRIFLSYNQIGYNLYEETDPNFKPAKRIPIDFKLNITYRFGGHKISTE